MKCKLFVEFRADALRWQEEDASTQERDQEQLLPQFIARCSMILSDEAKIAHKVVSALSKTF